jgi:uncharacterized protein
MRVLSVKAKPGARRDALTAQPDGTWLAEVTARPVDGQANEAVIALIARHFGVRRAQVRLKSGAASRHKRVEIDGDA